MYELKIYLENDLKRKILFKGFSWKKEKKNQ